MKNMISRQRLALAGLAVATAVVLSGCGGSGDDAAKASGGEPAATTEGPAATEAPAAEESSAAPAASTVDPCALVTKQDADKLAGTPVADAVKVRETCSYTAPPTGPTGQVEVYVGDGAKKILDIDRELGHEFRQIAGVGDECYAEDGAVFINKSGVWVAIQLVRLNDPAENRKPLEEIARKAAGRF
jgi:hypothetical protein